MDSALEPIAQKTDVVCAEVPNVVLHHNGVNDDLCCAENTACWEFHVVHSHDSEGIGIE